jgi:MFS family permease
MPSGASRLTTTQWLICVIASIGFAFDIYELLMLPLVLPPAIPELTGTTPGSPEFLAWVGRMFYIPAFVGGLFGLFGGYLTDRLGRRRVLTWSILLYAFSAFAAGYSTNIWMLLVLRCTTFIGVCVEFVAAVAWLAELFPDPHQRERVLGYTQAFSSIGGLLVAVANGLALQYAADLPAIAFPEWLGAGGGKLDPHAAWRYTLMSGLIPAIPLIVIRPFLPESPAWQAKKDAGKLRRPSIGELFAPNLRQVTIVTTLMFACSYGAAFGAIQQMPSIVGGLSDVKAKTAEMKVPDQKKAVQKVASEYTKVQEIGGLLGRFLLAMLAVRIVSRRALLRVFQWPGLFIVPLVFWFFVSGENKVFYTLVLEAIKLGHLPITSMSLALGLCGLVTVAQFSFWGNYLPRMYPMHLRGTGESFAANIGGRMIGTSFAAVTSYLATMAWVPGEGTEKFAHAAAMVALFVYACGSILSFFLPEPTSENLAED